MAKEYACSHCGANYLRTKGMRRQCSRACLFWSKVDRNGPTPEHVHELGACWVWTAMLVGGYGRLKVGRTHVGAHRVAWELTVGPIDEGACVCHRCDNPRCVNPAHLFIGAQVDNIADMVAKGRQRGAAGERNMLHAHPERASRGERHRAIMRGVSAKGERNSGAKLTEDEVRQIRHLCALGASRAAVATAFDVSRCQVNRIVQRVAWSHMAA